MLFIDKTQDNQNKLIFLNVDSLYLGKLKYKYLENITFITWEDFYILCFLVYSVLVNMCLHYLYA